MRLLANQYFVSLGGLIMNRQDAKYAKKEEERGRGRGIEKLIGGNYRTRSKRGATGANVGCHPSRIRQQHHHLRPKLKLTPMPLWSPHKSVAHPPKLVQIPVASAVGPPPADALNRLPVKPWLISPPSAENTKHSQASPGEKLISSLTV